MVNYKKLISNGLEISGEIFGRLIFHPWIQSMVQFLAISFVRGLWRSKLQALGKNSNIYKTVCIMQASKVEIGSNVSIGEFVHIWGGGGVSIGNDCLIASHCIVTSQTHDPAISPYRNSLIEKKVWIGNNVWLGAGAIVLPGIHIGNDAIIAAGSVVIHDVPPGVTVAGVPAQVLTGSKLGHLGH